MTAVVFFTGKSGNDALGAACRAHRPMFERLGYEFIEFNLVKPEAREMLNRAIGSGGIEFGCGAMGMGADISGVAPDGKAVNLWEGIRAPFISLIGDTPAYFYDRHVVSNQWHASLYFYPEHLEFRKRLPREAALYGVVPPIPFDLAERREVDFRRKESGKLLFLKNGNDPERLVQAWRDALPTSTLALLLELASELAATLTTDLGCDIDAFVTARFAEKGWDIEELVKLRLFFVAQLDDYLRRIKSTMMGKVLADFPIEIHGTNWEHVDFSGKRASCRQGSDYAQTRAEILDSLGIIDMSPNTQLAPHDRCMRAFGLLTLCLTNVQKFFVDNYTHADLFSFRFDKDHLSERVADVLAHPKRYVEVGIEVAEEFRRRHRPEDFAQYLVDTADHVRLACGPKPAGAQDYFVWPPTKLMMQKWTPRA